MRQIAARGVEELQNGVIEVERDMVEGDAQEITPRAVSVPLPQGKVVHGHGAKVLACTLVQTHSYGHTDPYQPFVYKNLSK
jgi:hypothetical protein